MPRVRRPSGLRISDRSRRVRASCLPLVLAFGAVAGCRAHAERPAGPTPIVLVSLDTLRADRVGTYGYTGGSTPNLDAFAKESVVFDLAYSQSSQTLLSHGSVFSGRYPSELGGLQGARTLTSSTPLL